MDSTMVLLAVGIMLGIEVIYTAYHFWQKHQIQNTVFSNWGDQDHSAAFSADELTFIKEQTKEHYGSFQVDDITWNDIDMSTLYQQMNRCQSASGDLSLYHMLRSPLYNTEAIETRKRLIDWAIQDEAGRNIIRSALLKVESSGEVPIDSLYTKKKSVKTTPLSLAYTLAILPIALFIGGFFFWPLFTYVILIGIMNCFFANSARKGMADDFDSTLSLYGYVRALQAVAHGNISDTIRKQYPIDELNHSLRSIKRSIFPDVHSGDGLIFLIIGNAFMGEVCAYYRLRSQLFKHREDILKTIKVMGELDAVLSVASYYESQPVSCLPTFVEDHSLTATAMLHPLLKDCVPNDVDVTHNVLISGSNASGKSTYLKMIALNCILSQSFGFALAKSYQATLFQVYTSMSLKDSIEDNDSYFVAEIKSIKRILEHVHDEIPVLTMIDEILRGTNTGERIAAASEVLMTLDNAFALTLAATHDMELTKILSNHYHNWHFSENLKEEQMQFDYHIHEGPSNSRNALALLSQLQFDPEVVKQAEDQLQYYETHSVWKKISQEVIPNEK